MKKNTPSMTYANAMEAVMRDNGGSATLGLLYREIWKYKNRAAVVGKTPDMTIQALAQRDPRFKRIGLGVYALVSAQADKAKSAPPLIVPKTAPERTEWQHATVQGMLLEIGNNTAEVDKTYTPDKGKDFDGRRLGDIATAGNMPSFTYPRVIRGVRYLDVIWFNSRGYPVSVFEVERSTNFRDALTKFCELQDFQTQFYCVAEPRRKKKYNDEISRAAFAAIKDRCEFRSYEQVESDYGVKMQEVYIK